VSREERRTATIQPTSGPRPLKVVVRAADGPGKGPSVELAAGTVVVGSHPDCDLVVDDAAVSRRHLTIELLAGEVRVTDLQSRNGTRYLGAKIATAVVPVGGAVQVGKTTLRIQPSAEPAASSDLEELHGLVGKSPAMRRLFTLLQKVGPQEVTVLLRGETGTGKGAAARALHQLSARSSGPFVVFDCASVHSNLMESALFGHRKGAFTGADKDRAGALELAAHGTLFLDEVGELPVALQPKLLRVLESRDFQRLGDGAVRRADVRVVAATHRNLTEEISAKRFRLDLFHRLAVTDLELPALRSRPEDIPLLARHFARQLAGVDVGLAPETVAAFQCATWPGNVRELRNAVERALAFGQADTSGPEEKGPASFIAARDDAMARFEKDYLVALLEQHGGNVSAAAKTAKLARSHLYRLMQRHDLVGKQG
jgi:DNA-binding NtrC family response regulator